MNLVNEGDTNGVEVEEDDIKAWAVQKGITFSNSLDEARFAEAVVAQLSNEYYTEGGKLVAPRRYNFIGYAFAKAEGSGVISVIEDDIYKSIEAEIGSVFSDKVIQLTIA